jgi:coenzyme F420-reducing hydrogenase alpha subunit
MTLTAPLRLIGHLAGTHIAAVSVAKARPLAARVLVGRPVAQVLQLVPALFSLCGRAQALAATAACAAAGAPGVARTEAWAEERAIAAETAQEHLWRLMLDWPALFGHEPRRERFAVLHRRLGAASDARAAFELGGDLLDLVAVELLGGVFQSMREPRTLAELVERARRGGNIGAALADLIEMGPSIPPGEAVPLLPAQSAAGWAQELGGVPPHEFCAAPTFGGRAHETGVLARHADAQMVRALLERGHRVAARLFARVVDLADCASRLRHPLASDMPRLLDAAALPDGGGLACVETARGVLLHALRVEGDRLVDYAIVAPTEWNFHADGPFAREGAGWDAPARDAALRRLKALVLALDPCVDFEIMVQEDDNA